MRFSLFVEQGENEDLTATLRKLPQSHRDLVKGFRFKMISGNTLKGDGDHIGYMDKGPKEIVVAAPWNYGREFAILHEIGHLVWDRLPNELKKHWTHIISKTKNKQDQEASELFCMAYSNFFAKNKIVIHDHPEWNDFIRKLT